MPSRDTAREELNHKTRQEIIKENQLHEKDTGSADVQIALLTEAIQTITEHLQRSPDDEESRLALVKSVAKRRRLLNYLNSTDSERGQVLMEKLKIRR